MRQIHSFRVHHSVTPVTVTVADIDREHRARGFAGIGYHYLIHEDEAGQWRTSPGRPEDRVGAHDQGENDGTIGICVAGDYTRYPLSPGAWRELVATLTWLCERFNLAAAEIHGHGENEPRTTPTACPGFNVGPLRDLVGRRLAAARKADPTIIVAGVVHTINM